MLSIMKKILLSLFVLLIWLINFWYCSTVDYNWEYLYLESVDTWTVNLLDYETKEKIDLEKGKIAITQKLARLENVSVGDVLLFNDANNIVYEYEVSVIIEHYIEHYIFMDKDTYELSGEEFTPNTVCIQTINLTSEEEEALSEELLLHDKVIYIS